jgi:hypothetical protein
MIIAPWIFGLISIASAETPPSTPLWNLNDVSILFSLPEPREESSELLEAGNQGTQGTLLPRSILDKVGVLNTGSPEGERTYENLRAVSLRYDPEKSEARLVWQPVVKDRDRRSWTTEDAAVHTFYRLPREERLHFEAGLLKLKTTMQSQGVSTDRLPLGIHPALRNLATRVNFRRDLHALILAHLGEARLYRFTAMKLLVPENWWKFVSGMERNANGVWSPAPIPRHGGAEIDIINDSTLPGEIDASLFALHTYPTEDDLRPVVSTGFRATFLSSEPVASDLPHFRRGIGAIHRFRNPKKTNPDTLDCAHCHFADPAMRFALKTFPALAAEADSHPDRFANPAPERFDLRNTTAFPESTKMVRAFGYFEDRPVFLTRTIHDSAESAEWLNRRARK